MNSEKRNYPKVSLYGEANIRLAGIVRNGTLMNLSPAGIQLECRHQLIEQLNKFKSDAGLFPSFELEFNLPGRGRSQRKIKSTCAVSYSVVNVKTVTILVLIFCRWKNNTNNR